MKPTFHSNQGIDWKLFDTPQFVKFVVDPTKDSFFMEPKTKYLYYPVLSDIADHLEKNKGSFQEFYICVNGVTVCKNGAFLKLTKDEFKRTQPSSPKGCVSVFIQHRSEEITQTWLQTKKTIPFQECNYSSNYWLPPTMMKFHFGFDAQKEDVLETLKKRREQIDQEIKEWESK